jgi:hypothetical protein
MAEMNLNNYKGIYFDDDNEKYTCPVTGAHFRFEEMCRLLDKVRVARGDPLVSFDRVQKQPRVDTEESLTEIPSELPV